MATASLESLVLLGAGSALAVTVLWLVLLVVVSRISPKLLRYLGPAWLVALFLAAAPAQAAEESGPAPATSVLVGLQLPDRPMASQASPAYVVRPGDSLWRIASEALGRPASSTEISAAVDAWITANRDAVGTNPNLIHPGQILNPPKEQP